MAVQLVERKEGPGGRLARVYCIPTRPWNPIDHLANLWDREIAVQKAPIPTLTPRGVELVDAQPVGTFVVDHWRTGDWIDAEAEPPRGGDVNVLVFHLDVEPLTRKCQSCGWTVGK